MNKQLAIAALATLSLAMQAPAVTIFSDTFDSENGGAGFLNYGTPNQNGDGGAGVITTSFAKWMVVSGGVDLIPLAHPSPTYGNTFDLTPGQGHGLYVDMEGTGTGPGTITLKNAISLGAGSYVLRYDMAGNQREGATDTVIINAQNGVPTTIATDTKTLTEFAPWTTYDIPFTLAAPTTVNFVFQDAGAFDNIGNLLDNVRLDDGTVGSVPDGGTTAALLGLGLVGLASLRRLFARA
jgi:VPDSG-CTERM motif